MSKTLNPSTPEQLIEVIQWANAHQTPLNVQGSASKTGIGRPVDAEHTLDLSGFTGISQYEPEELVLTAGAGTPLAEIEKRLDEHGQMLAFEPGDYSGLFECGKMENITSNAGQGQLRSKPGSPPKGTLGGILAGNITGPRRFYSGAARDHFLGFRAVSGRGEAFKSGGRVVKNVTGFDLSKLMAGSWGTLAACWEVTVKVLPKPEKTRTLLLFGLSDEVAARCLNQAAASSHGVSGACYLPAALGQYSQVSLVKNNCRELSLLALRVEGPEPSVKHRIDALRKHFTNGEHGDSPKHVEELHSHNSLMYWREVGNLNFLSTDKNQNETTYECWRLSVPPATSWQVAKQLSETANKEGKELSWYSDQAGGTLWVSCPENTPEQILRSALELWGGHATLWHASAERRSTTEVFQPQGEALAALTRRVKHSFDPNNILNPHRMYARL